MAGETGQGSGRRGNRWRIAVWGTAALLLLIPLVATQFSEEMAWSPADFVLMGAMLTAACGACELALLAGWGDTLDTIALTGLFVALWITSAWLFLKAARNHGSAGALA